MSIALGTQLVSNIVMGAVILYSVMSLNSMMVKDSLYIRNAGKGNKVIRHKGKGTEA